MIRTAIEYDWASIYRIWHWVFLAYVEQWYSLIMWPIYFKLFENSPHWFWEFAILLTLSKCYIFFSLKILQNLLIFVVLTRVKWHLKVVLIFSSLFARNIEQFYFLAILISFFKYSIQILCPFLNDLFVFFLIFTLWVLYILCIFILCQMCS